MGRVVFYGGHILWGGGGIFYRGEFFSQGSPVSLPARPSSQNTPAAATLAEDVCTRAVARTLRVANNKKTMEKYCLSNLAEWMFPSQRASTGVLRKFGETAGVFFPLKTSFLSEHRLHSQVQRRDCLHKVHSQCAGVPGYRPLALNTDGVKGRPPPTVQCGFSRSCTSRGKGGWGSAERVKKKQHTGEELSHVRSSRVLLSLLGGLTHVHAIPFTTPPPPLPT